MNEISPIGQSHPALARIAARRAAEAQTTAGASGQADSVELSQTAQLLSKLSEMPSVRQDLVDKVRSEIQAGTYETPQKMDAALESLLQDLQN